MPRTDQSAAAFDWAATPLGPRDAWPEDLRTAIDAAVAGRTGHGRAGAHPVRTDDPATPAPAAVLDALFRTAPLGLAVWDRNLRFLRINQTLADMNGIPAEDHVGRHPAEILPDIEDLDAIVARWQEVLDTGVPWMNVEVYGATPADRDAQRSWVEHFFPIEADGRILGLGAIIEETTERRRVENALRASEARFQHFAAASSDVLWIRNVATGAFEFISPSLGSQLEVLGPGGEAVNLLDMILPEDFPAAWETLRQAREGHPTAHDCRARRPRDGAILWVRITAFPMRDKDGVIRRLGGIIRDITADRASSERLTVLVGELQHRTRNLMGITQAIVENTLETATDFATFTDKIRDRIAALSRAEGLLSQVQGRERVAFPELIRGELAAFGALPEETDRVRLAGPDDVPLRSSSVQTLALAIHELVTNAVKYGALGTEKGYLTIRWWLEDDLGGGKGQRLTVDWREHGVTMAPSQAGGGTSGQGRELIEHALPYQLGATTRFALGDDGVHCTITLPVSTAGSMP
ncbi:PAS domain-containing protein [Sphingomonas sp. A2-49]|uniref:sensor histidine kinase n=1 Tax=Sphingomonas sp. A2-49 TaxID=1391375 RepID=UPI0021CE89F5|nr:PAS domain-containing protein [Sphingomonas sp. A2-49]MCU6454374.1 PAS domain-containing protein [Sphingomonas sp. A2-49]